MLKMEGKLECRSVPRSRKLCRRMEPDVVCSNDQLIDAHLQWLALVAPTILKDRISYETGYTCERMRGHKVLQVGQHGVDVWEDRIETPTGFGFIALTPCRLRKCVMPSNRDLNRPHQKLYAMVQRADTGLT